jgi:hypothetical protein
MVEQGEREIISNNAEAYIFWAYSLCADFEHLWLFLFEKKFTGAINLNG